MPIKLLCVGDIHLGRRSSKIDPREVDRAWLNLTEVLGRAVSYAIDNRVDAVLFSGDVADADNAFIEAYSPLRSALSRLLAAEIPVVAVAGNHDFKILARLSQSLGAASQGNFRVLGLDGGWESELLKTRSGEQLRVIGRSFCADRELENPLRSFSAPQDLVPTIGLLHCDVDAPGSRYAPVALADFKQLPLPCWVLGHIHKPSLLSQAPLVFYPGSLQGLDPGEDGARGPWLLTIGSGGNCTAELLPLAPIRYQKLEVSLTGLEFDAIAQKVIGDLESWHRAAAEELKSTGRIILRVTLTGNTRHLSKLDQLREELEGNSPVLDGTTYQIEKVSIACRPEVSLDVLSAGNDPLALLARRLQILQRREPVSEYERLIEGELRQREQYSPVLNSFTEASDRDAVREHLLNVGWLLLDKLVSQRTSTSEDAR